MDDTNDRISALDIAELDTAVAKLETSVAKLETTVARLETSIANMAATMIKWYIATSMALTGLVFGIAKYVR